MARKNILSLDANSSHVFPADTSRYQPHNQEPDRPTSRLSESTNSASRLRQISSRQLNQRRVRVLPLSNSLSSQHGSLALFSSFATPSRLDWHITATPRPTPARSAKKQPASYRVASSSCSDSSDSDHDVSIFCDDLDGSSCSSEDERAPRRDMPIAWPAEEIVAASPVKKISSANTAEHMIPLPLIDQENKPPRTQRAVLQLPHCFSLPSNPSKPSLETPPASPTKSRLNSPSKKARLPTPPGRPSLDAFWDAEEINTWNDVHSPRKPLPSPSKRHLNRLTSTLLLTEPGTPTKSPSKSSQVRAQQTSPRKSKSEVAARKNFDDCKDALATAFLAVLDENITNGEVGRCTKSTGGVRLVWSKTLNSTAGRASWKKETVRKVSKRTTPPATVSPAALPSSTSSVGQSREASPESVAPAGSTTTALSPSSSSSSSSSLLLSQSSIEIRHHATIELATKVITSEHRLYNTLAHEFCHLATYIVSGVRDRPHGAEFKAWGRKCDAAFGKEKGVKVTTKHGYEIEWRYLWICSGRDDGETGTASREKELMPGEGVEEDAVDEAALVFDGGCGTTYGRHSRSIDVDRARCGKCRGRLTQVRPAPRMNARSNAPPSGAGTETAATAKLLKKEPVGFAAFVKAEFASVKKELGPGIKHGVIMGELGRRWRARDEKPLSADERVATREDEGQERAKDIDGDELVRKLETIVIADD